jgi:hypothetical protein
MAKYYCTELSWKMVDTTLQLRGGRGYERGHSLKARGEEPFPVERMMRDSRINSIIEGTSEIMRLFLAREAMDPHLVRLAGLIKKSSSAGDKLKAALSMLGFYTGWYPKQWINGSWFSSHEDLGALAPHFKFIEKKAHKLARTLFHYMARYQQSLERRQMLLGRLIDIGTELFAMAATCSYARSLEREQGESAIALADHFCTLAQRRITEAFASLSDNDDRMGNKLAGKILDGDVRWLEEGIIGMDLSR